MPVPPPPASLGCCNACKYWLASEEQEFVTGPNGPVPVKNVPADQRLHIAKLPKMKAAPCTNLPNWIMQPGDGWCWQWKQKAASDFGTNDFLGDH